MSVHYIMQYNNFLGSLYYYYNQLEITIVKHFITIPRYLHLIL